MAGEEPLTNGSHEKFAQLIAGGEFQKNAYRAVFKPDATLKYATSAGCKLANLPKVKERIAYLRKHNADISGWTRELSIDKLKEIVNDMHVKPQDRIKAIEELNRMCGYNTPKSESKIQNNGIIFLAKDGQVSLPDNFLPEAIKALRELQGADDKPKEIVDVTVEGKND